jgi:hypothetical protein
MTKPGRAVALKAAKGTASAVGGVTGGAVRTVGTAAKSQGSKFGTLVADAVVAYGIKMIDDALETSRLGKGKSGSSGTE